MSLIPAVQRQRQTDLCKLKSAWSTWQVPGQPGLHRKTLSQIEKNNKTKHRQEARINPEEEAQGFSVARGCFLRSRGWRPGVGMGQVIKTQEIE